MNDINKISYAENISWTLFGDEVFVFNEITNELSLLKGIIKDFWLLLSKTENPVEITTMLAIKYADDEDEISTRILRKIRELTSKNLIVMEGVL